MTIEELIDRAWRVLPAEFKEEVKYEYHRIATKVLKSNYDLGFMNAHEGMFGLHNLDSDAEGEDEMLCVSRKRVQELHEEYCTELDKEEKYSASWYVLNGRNHTLEYLFGSKCLPDEKPKPTEPKEKPSNSTELKSQEADKQFDAIIKDGFAKERRLNIAAMAMRAIISRGKGYDPQETAITSLEYADALIKASEKGGEK